MKKIFIGIAVFFMLFGSALLQSAMADHLEWDANTDTVNGYIVYYQDMENQEIYNYDVGNQTTCALIDPSGPLNMVPGHTYDIHVKAYNNKGLSGESNHVQWSEPEFVPPANNIPADAPLPNEPSGLQRL
jgi:hypothetical protein